MKAICIALTLILPNSFSLLQAQQGYGSIAQQSSGSFGTGSTSAVRPPFSTIDPGDPYTRSPAMQQQIEKTRQNDRQRRLIADTNRLLALVSQLRSESDQATEKTASAESIRRLDEIEKLARNVKDHMKQ